MGVAPFVGPVELTGSFAYCCRLILHTEAHQDSFLEADKRVRSRALIWRGLPGHQVGADIPTPSKDSVEPCLFGPSTVPWGKSLPARSQLSREH